MKKEEKVENERKILVFEKSEKRNLKNDNIFAREHITQNLQQNKVPEEKQNKIDKQDKTLSVSHTRLMIVIKHKPTSFI